MRRSVSASWFIIVVVLPASKVIQDRTVTEAITSLVCTGVFTLVTFAAFYFGRFVARRRAGVAGA